MIFFVGTSQSNPIDDHDNGKERTDFSGSFTFPEDVNIPNLDGQYDLSDVSSNSILIIYIHYLEKNFSGK